MRPVNFDEQNATFHADGCEDLPAMYNPATGEVVTKWELGPGEMVDVAHNGFIWVIQHVGRADPASLKPLAGKGVQPISILTDCPFTEPS